MAKSDRSTSHDSISGSRTPRAMRLARGRLTDVDATNVQPESRKKAVAVAREYHMPPVAIVFWAFRPKNRRRFEADSQIPLRDEREEGPKK